MGTEQVELVAPQNRSLNRGCGERDRVGLRRKARCGQGELDAVEPKILVGAVRFRCAKPDGNRGAAVFGSRDEYPVAVKLRSGQGRSGSVAEVIDGKCQGV